MDLISILATVVLATTIATVLTGAAAYAAFKLRDRRKPKKVDETMKLAAVDGQEAIFLLRFVPEGATDEGRETPSAG
jgi:hypothetical protein